MKKNLFKLENVIQNYAWGSQSALTELFDIENPTSQPQAELWMGAHPNGCSRLVGSELTLAQLIEQSPAHALGDYTDLRFGQLPFLFKVLAAAKPLSVQVHPKLSKAKIGFEKENRVGLALNDSARNYKDGNHKPEPEPPIEAFHEGVLHRLAGCDVMPADTGFLAPPENGVRGHLRSIVRDDHVGPTASPYQFIQFAGEPQTRQ